MKIFPRLFPKGNQEERFDIRHPRIAPHIEPAFVAPGIHGSKTQFYKFKGNDYLDFTIGRYQYANVHMTEMEYSMTADDLVKYMRLAKEHLAPAPGGVLEVGKAALIIEEVEKRAETVQDPKLFYRLGSVFYFDDTEQLHQYDYPHNNAKIEGWEKVELLSFFLDKPIRDWLPPNVNSESDLREYFRIQGERVKASDQLFSVLASRTPSNKK